MACALDVTHVRPPEVIVSRFPELASIAAAHGLRGVWLVGSAARGDFNPNTSDVDLLVDFGDYEPGIARRAVAFHLAAEKLMGRRVDLISVHGIRNPTWVAIHEAIRIPVYAAA